MAELLNVILGPSGTLIDDPWSSLLITLSAILGGVFVGFDRESKGKPAGIRTMSVVSLGACVMTILSRKMGDMGGDPARIAAQIVSGIGFLGAGAIIQSGSEVKGLTTAATIWGVASMGMVCGAGYIGPGLGLSLIIHGVLKMADKVEILHMGPCKNERFIVRFADNGGKTFFQIDELLDDHHVFQKHRIRQNLSSEIHEIEFICCTLHKGHKSTLGELSLIPGVIELRQLS